MLKVSVTSVVGFEGADLKVSFSNSVINKVAMVKNTLLFISLKQKKIVKMLLHMGK